MSKDEALQPDPTEISVADQSSMRMMRRAELVPSKTNPRTHFDQAYLQELASSIREHRVIQPLLARPLPPDRLQDTFEDRQPGEPLPTHEIVCGECRWRASGIAQEEWVPVLIRELSDVQVLQIQLVENLKRRDLHPLEEAEGFDRLLKDHGLAAEDIAAKVDKSVSYIYKTLKLLELTPECREQMYSGKLNRSVALLIARAPAALQEEIARDVMTPDWQGEPMSFRAAAKLVQQRYMLQLSTAVFDIKDARLVPKAGDCPSCPKRTGSNADLFDDVDKPDTCTDPDCFDKKREAHYAKVAKEAKARGQTVIQGKEAKEIMPTGTYSLKGYKLLDESEYINGRTTTVRKVIGKDNMPAETVLIIDPHSNKPMEALPIAVANKLLKKATAEKKAANQQAEAQKEPDEHELKVQYETTWRTKAVRAIFARVTSGAGQAFGVGVARELALYLCNDLCAEEAQLVAELLDLGEIGRSNAIETHIKECPAEKVAPALLLIAMTKDLDAISYYNSGANTPFITALATDTGVDVKTIQADVKKEMKKAAADRKLERDAKAGAMKHPANKPAAKKTAKKASASEAKAAIAQALQQEPTSANDFGVGQRVRFKVDLKSTGGRMRKVAGHEGAIIAKAGDRAWSVSYGEKRNEVFIADYTELEHVDAPAGDDSLATGPIELATGVQLAPQAAWPFPMANQDADVRPLDSSRSSASTTADAAAAATHAAAWPFASTPKKTRGKRAAA